VQRLNDGVGSLTENGTRWVHRAALPHDLEFTWDQPVAIAGARVISGYNTRGGVTAPVADFVLQWRDGDQWRDIAGAAAQTNTDPAWTRQFEPVQTSRVRLRITRTQDNTSRLWEVEFYGPGQPRS
jgi:hypothetical protein